MTRRVPRLRSRPSFFHPSAAERHFRWRPAVPPGGLGFRPAPDGEAELATAQRRGDIVVEMDDADRRAVVRWNDTGFGQPVVGAVVARSGYGGIVLGLHESLRFDPQPISRKRAEPGRAWPLGPAVETPSAPPTDVVRALDAFFARSTGAYGVLIATPSASCANGTANSAPPIASRRAGR